MGRCMGADKAAFLGPIEKTIKEAKTETARKHREGNLAHATNLYTATNATVLALPNHPIDPAKLPMKVDLGGVTAVIESYPGHSGTDVIVRVLEQNVVYAGDLLFSGMYPVCFDPQATVVGWRETLKTFASWDKDTLFVPGHGPICGQEGIALSRALFDDNREQAKKMHKAGVPAAEAADLYEIPGKYKNVGIFSWDFSIGPAITKLYAQWHGQVAVGAFPAHFAAGAGYPEKLIGQNAVEVANDTARGGRRRCAAIAVAKDRLYSHGLAPLRFPSPHRKQTRTGVAHTKTKPRFSCSFRLRSWLPRGCRRKQRYGDVRSPDAVVRNRSCCARTLPDE